jgi:DNA repair protein RecO (recombination protein O)
MDFTEPAFVLSARSHGEAGAIVELLTETHGRWAAHVAGGASRRMKPFLQPGARVEVQYRSRVSEQLGSAKLEPVGEGPASLFDDPLALSALQAAAAITQAALPEREPHAGAFYALEALLSALEHPSIWPAVYVRWEAGLLDALGFGLDLSRCAATGATDDLAYVSPRTGRAVSREAGEPYKERLLPLPPFLLSAQGGLSCGDIGAGLAITGRFLESFVFNPLNRPLPPARMWLVDRLAEAGRL